MKIRVSIVALLIMFIISFCKKEHKTIDCFPNLPTIRHINNKKAVVKLTATQNDVYLVEEGTIDTRLIPCNFPMKYYQDNLQVIISGEVKSTVQTAFGPCCVENFVITKISR